VTLLIGAYACVLSGAVIPAVDLDVLVPREDADILLVGPDPNTCGGGAAQIVERHLAMDATRDRAIPPGQAESVG
jgi:hypothetical protein